MLKYICDQCQRHATSNCGESPFGWQFRIIDNKISHFCSADCITKWIKNDIARHGTTESDNNNDPCWKPYIRRSGAADGP